MKTKAFLATIAGGLLLQASMTYAADTALLQAALSGHEAILQVLIDTGVQLNTQDQYGNTALHKAARKGHKSVVRMLLDAGAQVDAQDSSGSTALSLAVQYRQANTARELVKAGATLTPQVEQILIVQGETEFLLELRKLAVQRLEANLAYLEEAPAERLPNDIADLLLQFESLPAQRLQQLRAIRTQQRQAVQQP